MGKYCVTITRTGWVFVEADTPGEAMDIADHQYSDTIIWAEDWGPTDVEEDDSGEKYITEREFD